MPRRASRRTSRLLIIGGPLLVVVIVAWFGYSVLARASRQAGSYQSEQPDFGPAPSYTLTDQNGHRVSSTKFAGKVQVVTFLFPYCTTFCPTITHTLKQLEGDLRQEGIFGSRVEFVAFNVDPTGSGPPEMRQFLSQYGVSPTDPGWHYLTGTKAQIERVVHGGFHVYYDKISRADEDKQIAREKAEGIYTAVPNQQDSLAERKHVNYDIVHEDHIEIVDSNGGVSQVFSGDNASETKLFKAVRSVAVPNA